MKKEIIISIIFVLFLGSGMRAKKVNFNAVNYNEINKIYNIDRSINLNGFSIQEDRITDLEDFYKNLRTKNIPIFISADCMIHTYHILFDYALKKKELDEFIPNLSSLIKKVIRKVEADTYTDYSKKGSDLLISYLMVAYALLNGKESIKLADIATKEVDQILNGSGFSGSKLFKYKEDYSQYKPRGHYTQKPELEKYFRSMMYMGRMTFLANYQFLKKEDLGIQTAAAIILTTIVSKDTELQNLWSSLFDPISFLVGASDDLTIRNYKNLIVEENFGFDYRNLNQKALDLFREKVKLLPMPKIYSGLGDIMVENKKEGSEAIKGTQGLRFFGQRFVIDSFIFSRLVYPFVGKYQGSGKPFTCCDGLRAFPMGLDILNCLSIDKAANILKETENSNYIGYDKEIEHFRNYFRSLKDAEWNKTIYTKWIQTLSMLFGGKSNKKGGWFKRLIRTFLGSWAELRHDTILYVKQSYTMKATSFRPRRQEQKNRLPGFPENNLKFWERFIELCTLTENFYDDDFDLKNRFLLLKKIGLQMAEILNNNGKITDFDSEYFYKFPDTLGKILRNIDKKTKKAIMVADVHTDSNSGRVLEEGVGGFSRLFVIEKITKTNMIFVGPVFNYYEFKMPMSNRLTDEEFEKELNKNKIRMPEFLK